jgi:maltose alpha-D-glucosyltransferase/alpha-amylase
VLAEFERDVLPLYVSTQAWFRAPRRRIERTTLVDAIPLDASANPPYVLLVDALDAHDRADRYFLPASLAATGDAQGALVSRAAFARVRRGPRDGVLFDGVADDRFWRGAVEALQRDAKLTGGRGVLSFAPTWSLDGLDLDDVSEVRRVQEPRNNNDDAAVVANSVHVRTYRQVEAGIHPEIELGRYLHDAAFEHAPPLLGTIEYVTGDGTPYAIGIAHRFVENQGDGWRVALRYLERFLERRRHVADNDALASDEPASDEFEPYERSARAVGRVLAALHRTLAEGTSPEFLPEPYESKDLAQLTAALRESAHGALDALAASLDALPSDSLRAEARALLAEREALFEAIERRAATPYSGVKTRIHGRFHLGNVLVTDTDVLITGFDGDRRVPFAERRRKALPLEDVAGVLQSFDYAEVATIFGLTLDRKENLEAFAPELAELKRHAAGAFLAAYEREAKATIPRAMLELFVLDRALYSIRYELANRPSWIAVPLRTIRGLVNTGYEALV